MMREESLPLGFGEGLRNLDDPVPSSIVDFWVVVANEIEDILGERPVACAHFVDDEVFVREMPHHVL